MRFLNLLVCALLGFSAQAQNLADTQWQLYPGAGALGVGPNQGDIGWWSNNDGDVATRACLFDDIYAFNADGSFQNILGDETWVEGWQTGAGEMCGAPVAPHDGSAAASWSVAGSELTLDGMGAFMGLAKVFNGGELGNPADAPASITYTIESLTDDAMTLDIHFGAGWWRFRFVPVGTELSSYDLTLEVNTANIEVGPNGMYAGGGVLGDAQAVALSDDDGDGIWSGTVSLPEGTSGNYIFLNSPNDGGDWGAKENLDGLECSDPANYNDRILAPLTGNTTISTCFGQCSTDGTCAAPAETYDVTFQVDMSTYEGAFGTVNLNGNFNGWCGGCAEMTDADGDGVYSLTVPLSAGSIEYKFTLDGWNAQEGFDGSESCTTAPAEFVNRAYEVAGEATLDVVCYNSCDACEPQSSTEYAVTFRVDMNDQTTNPIGVFVAGNFQGWAAGATAMSDDDGDDIWEYTAMIAEGEAVEYKFINGPNWGLDESIPVACAVNGNRGFTVGAEDAVLDAVCFGACLPCGSSLPTEEVTFTVLTDNIEVAADGMHIAGAMNGWSGEPMNDNGDGSWSITLSLEAATYEYKYQNGLDGWEELDCGGNRSVVVELGAPVSVQGCFSQCSEVCSVDPDPADVTFQVDASQIEVSADGLFLMGSFTEPAWQFGAIAMNDDDGDGIWTATANISGAATFAYKFNNGAPVVEDVAVYDGEESGDFAAEGCGVDNGVGGFNRTHERSGVAETLDVVCFNSCQACSNASAELSGTQWQLYPGAGALGVGPNQGDIGWWSNNDGDVATRACLFDDIYAFNADGSFQNILGDETWVEGWQTGAGEMCGAPVAPHDGSAAASWSVAGSELTLDGMGAFMGLAKVFNGGELGNPADAPASITYTIESLTDDAMTLDIHFGAGWWRFRFVPVGTELSSYDLTLEVNTANIEVGPNGMYAGGGVLGDAQAVALSDDDGDGIWSGTVSLPEGTSGNYIFLNSPNDGGDWGAKENLDGLECSDPANYNDRILAPLTGNTTISTCFGQCSTDGTCAAPAETYDVTFQVDMSTYEGAFGTVNLNGNFNGWCGGCAEMTDADGDGVYSLTVPLSAGSIEYKFTLDGWNAQEEFAGGESCTVTDGTFVNRGYEVVGEATLDVVCYNSCDACDGSGGGGDTVSLTFNVNTANIEVGPNGIYLGGGVFGDAQAHAMSDDDNDGVWTVTLEVAPGLSGNYIFLNSPNDGGDWGAKENLAGLECADPANFDDRILAPVTEDTVLSTCFGQCSTDGSCAAPPATYDVTFRVDMSTYEAGYGTVNLNGSFNGWCGGCTEMTDNDGDMVYEVTVALAEGTFEYKFTLDGWTAQEEFDGSEACVSTIDGYNNRSLDVAGEAVLDVVCWNSCEACVVIPEVLGCTNPEFLEYDPYATSDDGSCSNLLVPGCMYENATNYNPLANDDDNSCEFEDGGNNDCPADLDGDGAVTTSDLLSFLAEFGASCS